MGTWDIQKEEPVANNGGFEVVSQAPIEPGIISKSINFAKEYYDYLHTPTEQAVSFKEKKMASWLDEIYQKNLGRNYTPGEDQGFWENVRNTHGLGAVEAGVAGSSEAMEKRNRPEPEPEGLPEINLEAVKDLYPKASSGLPDWGEALIKDYATANMGTLSAALSKALSGLEQAPDLIEKTRQNMVNQYKNAMDLRQKESLKPLVSNLAARGVVNSTTASDAIAKLMEDYQAKYSDQVINADTWAANSLLGNLGSNVATYQKQMALLNSLIDSTKRSSSTNELAPYSLLLPMLLGQA